MRASASRLASSLSPALLALLALLGADSGARAQTGEPAPPRAEPSLAPETFRYWRDRILPSATETAFRSIPWRTDLATAVADAKKAGRPILLWLMNGHPLGPT